MRIICLTSSLAMLEVVLATLLLNHEVQHGVSHDLHALVGDPSALVQVGVGFIHSQAINKCLGKHQVSPGAEIGIPKLLLNTSLDL